jgi:protein-S-isoprenylcysteine O-methyltransferase Ste14
MDATNTDNAGVVVKPPILYFGVLAVGLVLETLWPAPFLPETAQCAVGGAAILTGQAMVVACMGRFRAAGTPVGPYKPTSAIVSDGLYGLSRNPIYVALTLIYLGIGVAIDSPWILALVVPVLLVMRTCVIVREERYLERKFGAEDLGYKASVRRWV